MAALLQQHPDMHLTATSSLLNIIIGVLKAWSESIEQKSSIQTQKMQEKEIQKILESICKTKYANIKEPIVLDKSRSWASEINLTTMREVLGYEPKVIATVRNVEDCVASMVRVANPNNLPEFFRTSKLIDHVKKSYQTLLGAHNACPEYLHYVEYEDLVSNPEKVLCDVEKFLGLTPHTYDINNIDASNLQERDEKVWGIKGLHNVRKTLKKQDTLPAKDVLGYKYREFVQPRFWQGETNTSLPIHKLDMMLGAGLLGDLNEAARLGDELGREEPFNNRAAFNRGWYELRRNNLLKGHRLMFQGRHEGVFGNPPLPTPAPLWDGVSKGTVLLNLEGGLGDQIHGAGMVRYIVNKGCDVVVACSPELMNLFRDIPGVSAVAQLETAGGVIHDFWVPAMSAVIPLELQYADVDGSPYISKPLTAANKKFRIGLRWQGNPEFEHEQHRLFPSNKLFDAVKDMDADFISLQRDEGSQHKPEWVKEVPLQHWGDTRHAIATCNLVITSCTSVAHLSAAMGVNTWIIVPILPYYLWAKDGSTTEWYDSVTLFRQTKFKNWDSPFLQIQEQLNSLGDTNGNTNRVLATSNRRRSKRSLGHHAA